MKTIQTILLIIFVFAVCNLYAQNSIPKVYTNIEYDQNGKLFHTLLGKKFFEKEYNSYMTLENMIGNPEGTNNGITFNFGSEEFFGKLYFGFIDYTDSHHPMPVFFKRYELIEKGIAEIQIKTYLNDRYDMINWEETGFGTIGYRVVNDKGEMLYDGKVSFSYQNGNFSVIPTIIEGPFINKLSPEGAVISFKTNRKIKTKIKIDEKNFEDKEAIHIHEIKISGLESNTKYEYSIQYGQLSQSYTLKTALKKGERKPFVFAYASDSRAGQGGGERNVYGTNYYIMKKIAALAYYKNAAFLQFTGDLVNGYSYDKRDIILQYANWKRAVETFGHHFPIVAGLGNHELTGKLFVNDTGTIVGQVDGFPFETESSSAVFANQFVNFENGPESEDGAYYDPDPTEINFPPYKETVFYYTYGNVAMIVLNSDYLYSPSLPYNKTTGGNIHAYIMDIQLKWLDETVEMFEKDAEIDHIFVTQHTPAFPNGGHVHDDMWYSGNNEFRPIIAGEPVEKGIIQRRDQYLDILINKSNKVRAILTGDEHNYNKVKISPDVNIYPERYEFQKIERSRTIWQINNGSAGAPYYAQDKSTPWTDAVSNFSTQTALVFIYVDGDQVDVKVMNPETLETIDKFKLN